MDIMNTLRQRLTAEVLRAGYIEVSHEEYQDYEVYMQGQVYGEGVELTFNGLPLRTPKPYRLPPTTHNDHEREYGYAIALAHQVLDRVNADPDDDIAVLSRQFLRAVERLARSDKV